MKLNVLVVCAALPWLMSTASAKGTAEKAVPKPPLPAISSIELEPTTLTLHDARDARRVLVWGKTGDGQRIDLTSEATLKTDSSAITIDPDHYIEPKSK